MASKKQKLQDMPPYLRGFSNNRWGGHKSNCIRGFRGSTCGKAIKGQHIQPTPELVAQCERRHSVNQAQRLRINRGGAGPMPPLPIIYS